MFDPQENNNSYKVKPINSVYCPLKARILPKHQQEVSSETNDIAVILTNFFIALISVKTHLFIT